MKKVLHQNKGNIKQSTFNVKTFSLYVEVNKSFRVNGLASA